MKRADENPAMKAGARQMLNWRILNSRAVQQRPGRSIQFLETGRVEEVRMSPGNIFYIVFTPTGRLRIYSLVGVLLFDQGGFPWSTSTLQNIVYDIFRLQIFITCGNVGFPGMRPQVLSWDGVSAWSLVPFSETVLPSGQKRTVFYRLSPQNVAMIPSAITGAITVTFSAAIAVAGMVGTRIRYAGRQILITGFISTTQLNATVIEPLPPGMTLAIASSHGNFALGDVVRGATSGAEGIVVFSPTTQTMQIIPSAGTFNLGDAVTGSTSGATGVITAAAGGFNFTISLNTGTVFVNGETITDGTSGATGTTGSVSSGILVVQLLTTGTTLAIFAGTETIAGPSAQATLSSATITVPQTISVWDDEVMNAFRGWPSSVFVDQFRVNFCNFPALPNGIGWSAINSPLDFYVDGTPANALFELTPSKSQVFFVVPGPESGEFVFCDNKVFYIPISVNNPLKSGGVEFNILSSDGAANVQPRATEELIFYVTASTQRVKCVVAPGAYYRPFNTVDVSENHIHLFTNIIALATPTTDSSFPERYCYALNSGGAVVVGKYSSKQGQIEGVVGWLPWSGVGTVNWLSATIGSDVIMSTSYFGVSLIEKLDASQYLDGAVFVNNLPAALTAPVGKGPLWFIPGQSVFLMDLGTRQMGVYQIDGNGNIFPQFIDGENLLSSQLVAGQPWTGVLEPFVPDANPGNSVHQRMFRRRVSRMAVYVSNSTGFLMARLFAGPLTPTSPALGTIMNTFRVTAYNQGDDPTKPPPLREEAQRWRPIGRAYDPRVAVIKDVPGPILVHEIGLEASI